MPAGDRSGPWGEGPRTGRGMGDCNSDMPIGRPSYRFGRGRGFGRGMGYGRGRGPVYQDTYRPGVMVQEKLTPEEEKRTLQDTLKKLEEDVIAVKSRMKELG